MTPDTHVTTSSAVVGPNGVGYLKEDVQGDLQLTATPGVGDQVTEIKLSGIPAGWSVDTVVGHITLSNGTVGAVTLVGGVLTIPVVGATAGAAVTATVHVTPSEDTDVDGTGLTVTAHVVDGANAADGSSGLNVTVDAVLDQYLDVGGSTQTIAETAGSNTVGLGLSAVLSSAGFANSGAGGADTDGSEVRSVTVVLNSPLPAGGSLSIAGGAAIGTITGGPTSFTLTPAAGHTLGEVAAAVQVTLPAGFDGSITGHIDSDSHEANTPQGSVAGSGLEPDTSDNTKTDTATFTLNVTPDTHVTTSSAVVGPNGVGYLKEDVQGDLQLTATPGVGDQVTEIKLSGIPAGWSVDTVVGHITLSNGTVGAVTLVGGVLTIPVVGATAGAAVTATVHVTPSEDTDVDGTGLTVTAHVVDGANAADGSSGLNVTVDAVLDQYLDVGGSTQTIAETAGSNTVGLGLSAVLSSAGFANSGAGGADTDGSEVRSVTVVLNSPLPAGGSLSIAGGAAIGTITGGPTSFTLTPAAGHTLGEVAAAVQVTLPAGFDGSITGHIDSDSHEANTPQGSVAGSGLEPDTSDNTKTDTATFTLNVTPDTHVTTSSAVVGPNGVGYLKEDVQGDLQLTATPGVGDQVTEIKLSGIPAGWSVDTVVGHITLSNGTVGAVTLVGGVLTIPVVGATAGAAVTATVHVTPSEDTDVDGTGLTVTAHVVDGANAADGSSGLNVTVDAVLDQYLDVGGSTQTIAETAGSNTVGLGLSAVLSSAGFANSGAGGADTDGSEVRSVTVVLNSPLPAGGSLSIAGGAAIGTITGGPTSFTLTPAAGHTLGEVAAAVQVTLPAGFDGSITGHIDSDSHEANTPQGSVAGSGLEPDTSDNTKTDTATFTLNVTPDTHVTTSSAVVGPNGVGYLKEDVQGDLQLTATPGVGDQVTEIKLSGIPAGWSVDTVVGHITLSNGTVGAVTLVGGVLTIPVVGATAGAAVTATVHVTPSEDTDVDGTGLTVTAHVVDGANAADGSSGLNVTVDAVLDQYLDVGGSTQTIAETAGSNTVGLGLSAVLSSAGFANSGAGGADTDGSEVRSVTVVLNSPLPAGGSLSIAGGAAIGTITGGPTSFTLTPAAGHTLGEVAAAVQVTLPAGFDGSITGHIDSDSHEANTPQGSVAGSGLEPDTSDNTKTDTATFTLNVTPDTHVTTSSAVVGPNGVGYLKEDVQGDLQLTATPGVGDQVTEIKLSGIPAGWSVDTVVGHITLSNGTVGAVTLVGGVLTIPVVGATAGAAVTATVHVTPSEDTDVDGTGLTVTAHVVDGANAADGSSGLNVTVDAVLDQYLDVGGSTQTIAETAGSNTVGLGLSAVLSSAGFANSGAGGADTDGSEVRSVTVVLNSPLPAGGSLSIAGGAAIGTITGGPTSFTLTPAAGHTLGEVAAAVQVTLPAGFDGSITGHIDSDSHEANTPQGSVAGSGLEPDTSDNTKTDTATFTLNVTPDTHVTTSSAVVGPNGVGYLKEDVQGDLQLTATPGVGDQVTEIKLSGIPAGWSVDTVVGHITLSNGTVGAVTLVGGVLTIPVVGATAGAAVTATVHVTPSEDTDVDGTGLTVTAHVVDGANAADGSSGLNVTVDAVLDQYLDVGGSTQTIAETAGSNTVGLGLSAVLSSAGFANSGAGGADTDGSEVRSVTVVLNSPLPAGGSLSIAGGAAIGTITGGPTSFTLTPAAGHTLGEVAAAVQVTLPAGFDGSITGHIDSDSHEANTPQGSVAGSGLEPDTSDNTKTDTATFTLNVTPDTHVTTSSAVVGPNGVGYLKEDVQGDLQLTATPGVGDQVTEIKLSGIPAGWSVDTVVGHITLSNGTVGAVTLVGGVLTIPVVGATAGAAVTATVHVTPSEDTDVDGTGLTVTAHVVDGANAADGSSGLNVTVDAVLDQYLDVGGSTQTIAETAGSNTVGLGLSAVLSSAGFANSGAGGADTDGSEVRSVTVVLNSPLPAGGSLSIAGGAAIGTITGGPTSFTLTPAAGHTLGEVAAAVQVTLPAGFDGSITGHIDSDSHEANTPQGSVAGSGLEPDTSDNTKTDTATFTLNVTPDTHVTTSSAVVGPNGVGYLKEDVQGDLQLTATPGVGDQVTEIKLSGIPAGWSVDTVVGHITLSNGTVGAVTLVGGVLTIPVVGATAGAAVTATVHVTPSEDTDVDGTGLTVTAHVVDGANAADGSSGLNVTVDAVLDQFVDVSSSALAAIAETIGAHNASLGLSAALSSAAFANSLAGGADTDGSELYSVTVAIDGTSNTAGVDLVLVGAPAGSILTEMPAGSGSYVLTATSAANLASAVSSIQASLPAGFDGTITGTLSSSAKEANTPQGSVAGSGNEPDVADNTKTDTANFTLVVNKNLPTGGTDTATVAEHGNEAVGTFAAGTLPATNDEDASGTLTFSYGPDGAAASNPFLWNTGLNAVVAKDPDNGNAVVPLTSGGSPITWTSSTVAGHQVLTGTVTGGPHNGDVVATIDVDPATKAYTFHLLGAIDHPDVGQSESSDTLSLAFNYTVKDATNDTANGTINIVVKDDAPVANAAGATAAATAVLNTNLVLILDDSGSMGDASGLQGLNKLQALQAAVNELLEQYGNLGEVRICFTRFDTSASNLGAQTWLTLDQAKTVLATLSAGGNTNYDAALLQAISAFDDNGRLIDGFTGGTVNPGNAAPVQNVSYFISDGQPTANTDWPTVSGTLNQNGIQAGEETAWENFLKDFDIKSYAIGVGPDFVGNEANIEPISYDGRGAGKEDTLEDPVNGDAGLLITLTDFSQLQQALVATIPPVSATLLSSGNTFGADDGFVKSLTFGSGGNTTTISYNPAAPGSVSVVNAGTGGGVIGAPGWVAGTFTLTVVIAEGTLVINMETGSYTFTPVAGLGSTTIAVGFTLSDFDGDTASNVLTLGLSAVNVGPIARDDLVITADTSGTYTIDSAWLTFNDTDANADAISITCGRCRGGAGGRRHHGQ